MPTFRSKAHIKVEKTADEIVKEPLTAGAINSILDELSKNPIYTPDTISSAQAQYSNDLNYYIKTDINSSAKVTEAQIRKAMAEAQSRPVVHQYPSQYPPSIKYHYSPGSQVPTQTRQQVNPFERRVKIIQGKGVSDTRIFLDGKDISSMVARIDVSMGVGELPRVSLELVTGVDYIRDDEPEAPAPEKASRPEPEKKIVKRKRESRPRAALRQRQDPVVEETMA